MLKTASELAQYAEETGVGNALTAYDDVAALVRDPRVDAVWVLTPNDSRLDVVRTICEEVTSGRSAVTSIAIEVTADRPDVTSSQIVRTTSSRESFGVSTQTASTRGSRTRAATSS